MLQVDFRALDEGPVETIAAVEPGDPLFADLPSGLRTLLAVRGRLVEAGPGRYFWKARIATTLDVVCRRCLTTVALEVTADIEALFTTESSSDDATVYELERGATECDLRPAVREELLLAVPEYPVCREDCRGLCARCGTNLNDGPCSCGPEPDPRWAALRALQDRDG
jgi:uncharacterized protein